MRERRRRGQLVVSLVVDCAVLDTLVRLHWLPEAETASRSRIAEAIRRALVDAAEAEKK